VTRRIGGSAAARRRRATRAFIAASTIATLVGCTSAVSHTPAEGTPSPQTPATVATPAAVATPTPAAPATTLAACAAAVTRTALHVVHRFSVSPDDIAIDTSGRLWVSAREADQLIGLNPDGSGVTTVLVPGGPEGVTVAASAIYVAQQNLNAIAEITPQRRQVIALPNRTANAGIDGIAIGATSQTLLIPDSPNGRLLELSLLGPPSPRVVATHLGRPVSAAVVASGDIFVASESSPGLVAITPGGAVRNIGGFTDLDEVVAYAGLLYVTELNRHDVVAVDPTSGASVALAVGLPAPQGLAVTAKGTLEVVDATTDTVYSLPACGVA
jgi:sugar lactone lactonase YvrE